MKKLIVLMSIAFILASCTCSQEGQFGNLTPPVTVLAKTTNAMIVIDRKGKQLIIKDYDTWGKIMIGAYKQGAIVFHPDNWKVKSTLPTEEKKKEEKKSNWLN